MENIVKLQKDPKSIRNICVLAHVDHGKTTLSDCLLSSNGIISQKMAGKVRYLDSRPDEQSRGITMKSSAISLYFAHITSSEADASVQVRNDYLINLIDSPGHVDFASEVSSASRLCDGALLLVDALEGVCAQTHTVLKQAIQENLKPILVLNKIDRLILELKQTPAEAFVHLSNIIEQVNAILGHFEQQDMLKSRGDFEYTDESNSSEYYFSPEKGNVIFASAIDGWAFRTSQFARIYAKKLGINEAKLGDYLWGAYYLDPKQKTVVNQKGLKGRNFKPLFVQFIIDNIWLVYDTIMNTNDLEKLEKIIAKLEIKVIPRELKSRDKRSLLQTVMSQWLPLSHATLLTVVQKVPDPIKCQAIKVPSIISNDQKSEQVDDIIRESMKCNNSEAAPLVCFLSKVFSVAESDLPIMAATKEETQLADDARRLAIARSIARQNERDLGVPIEIPDTAQDVGSHPENVLIGLVRIYSGIIKVGQSVYILNPKYNANDPNFYHYYSTMTVERLFILMGKELHNINEVSAGNVFGIMCSNTEILKTATLTSTLACPSLACLSTNSPPILQVAVTPKDPSKLPQLIKGLELLEKADTCAEVFLNDIGEYVLVCAGELHVERCVNDLRDRFAKIDITVSKPLVPFKESITPSKAINFTKTELPLGVVEKESQDGHLRMKIRVIPLPRNAQEYLTNKGPSSHDKKAYLQGLKGEISEGLKNPEFANLEFDWTNVTENIIAFGPKSIGPNILVNQTGHSAKLWHHEKSDNDFKYLESVISGFQLATQCGPLCAEPLAGVLVALQTHEVADSENASTFPGQILSLVKDSISRGFLQWSPRLLLAYYSCELQTEAQSLGRVDGVLSKRRGKIVSEDIKDGTTLFTLIARLPVVESFGFVDELLKRTSGLATPQLVFAGFEVLDQDPFWVPSTETELEDLGDLAERDNIAKMYMEGVRERKGMPIEKKVVEFAEKQKTLKSK